LHRTGSGPVRFKIIDNDKFFAMAGASIDGTATITGTAAYPIIVEPISGIARTSPLVDIPAGAKALTMKCVHNNRSSVVASLLFLTLSILSCHRHVEFRGFSGSNTVMFRGGNLEMDSCTFSDITGNTLISAQLPSTGTVKLENMKFLNNNVRYN
jgi:hypothetical protein